MGEYRAAKEAIEVGEENQFWGRGSLTTDWCGSRRLPRSRNPKRLCKMAAARHKANEALMIPLFTGQPRTRGYRAPYIVIVYSISDYKPK